MLWLRYCSDPTVYQSTLSISSESVSSTRRCALVANVPGFGILLAGVSSIIGSESDG